MVIPHVPGIVKVLKSTYAYAFHISEQPPIELFLDEIDICKGLDKDQKISKKVGISLLFWIKDSMPLKRILDQDYHVLRSVYVKLDTKTSFSQGIRSEILKKIEDIRRKWNEASNLPLRLGR